MSLIVIGYVMLLPMGRSIWPAIACLLVGIVLLAVAIFDVVDGQAKLFLMIFGGLDLVAAFWLAFMAGKGE
ncbi:hypothetical protein QM565_36395 [Geitlerinema splendidum]|nr:hypothetical protein [Geitlerinema splendidum]